jgi:hypothetical protein
VLWEKRDERKGRATLLCSEDPGVGTLTGSDTQKKLARR